MGWHTAGRHDERDYDIGKMFSSREAIKDWAAPSEAISLGASLGSIRIWLSPGASSVYVSLSDVASSDNVEITDADVFSRIAHPHISTIYLMRSGTKGYVNIEAW